MVEKQDKNKNLVPRPPIVVVMGHVDHGKTALLDYIRKTNVDGKEAGGITQSIGAYEIIHNEKRITFIDTPGHEAFSKMRAHGANVADLAVLVVAADEGPKLQTQNALKYILEAEIPYVVALNKIDKANANIEKTKQDLAKINVLLEGHGGNVSCQEVSAKTGEGIPGFLDLILLAAELEGLTYDASAPASGVILTGHRNTQRGLTVGALITNGVLKKNDSIFTETAFGKIKILENFQSEQVDLLQPSAPAMILGFENLPEVGEAFSTERDAIAILQKKPKTAKKNEA